MIDNGRAKKLDNYKSLLIDVFSSYYGEKYHDKIKEAIDDTCYNFSSLPQEEFKYASLHKDEMSKKDFQRIKINYEIFKIRYNRVKKRYNNMLKKKICSILEIKESSIKKEDENKFLSLFKDDDFNLTYISYFHSNAMKMLDKEEILETIKESILNDQKKFEEIANELKINFYLTDSRIEKIKHYVLLAKDEIMDFIARKTNYGKSIATEFYKKFEEHIDYNILCAIVSATHPVAGIFKINYKEYHYIGIPFSSLANKGNDCLDVQLIHELIHRIEANGRKAGIEGYDKQCEIANEIRTQKNAIKITKKLHENNIYVFDDPDKYSIEHSSIYEDLFPLTFDFFDKYEKIINEIAIIGKNDMCDYFGTSWLDYSELLKKAVSNIAKYNATGNIEDLADKDYCFELIKKMENHYEQYMKGKKKSV